LGGGIKLQSFRDEFHEAGVHHMRPKPRGRGQVVAFLFEGGGLEFPEDPAELIWLATSNEIRPRKFHFMTDKFHKVKSACYWNQ
jgi:hypothetical protein